MNSGMVVTATLDRHACSACGGTMGSFLAARDYNWNISNAVFHLSLTTVMEPGVIGISPKSFGFYYFNNQES
jgi:hypothetical protein